jgi:hypothetical protein
VNRVRGPANHPTRDDGQLEVLDNVWDKRQLGRNVRYVYVSGARGGLTTCGESYMGDARE